MRFSHKNCSHKHLDSETKLILRQQTLFWWKQSRTTAPVSFWNYNLWHLQWWCWVGRSWMLLTVEIAFISDYSHWSTYNTKEYNHLVVSAPPSWLLTCVFMLRISHLFAPRVRKTHLKHLNIWVRRCVVMMIVCFL